MNINELITKVENISMRIKGKDIEECRLIMVDEIIKLEYRINDLQDELKYTFEKMDRLKNDINKESNCNYGKMSIELEQLKEENELLMRENLNLIMKLNSMKALECKAVKI